jgi:hypothetical protein
LTEVKLAASNFTLSKQSMQQNYQAHQAHHTTNLPLQPSTTLLLTSNITYTRARTIRADTTAPSLDSRLIVNMTPIRISRSLVVFTWEPRVVVVGHDRTITTHMHDGCVVAAGTQGAETRVGHVGWAFQEVGTF